jgi:electron transfer flavoprotein beta subunit
MAMGSDRGVHLKDEAVGRKDPFQIASIIAAFAVEKGFDLIFTGLQSQDRGSGQVGMLLAEILGFSAVSTVVGFEYADGRVTVKRELEGGMKSIVRVRLPALVTCQLGLNTPRYPTMPNILKAKKKELLTLDVTQLLKVEPRLTTENLFFPEKKSGLVLDGSPNQVADQLLGILREKTKVLL